MLTSMVCHTQMQLMQRHQLTKIINISDYKIIHTYAQTSIHICMNFYTDLILLDTK